MIDLVHAPWTSDQVASLNAYQECEFAHPFTGLTGAVLVASEGGWRETRDGPVVQTWCHPWMADWSWKRTWEDI